MIRVVASCSLCASVLALPIRPVSRLPTSMGSSDDAAVRAALAKTQGSSLDLAALLPLPKYVSQEQDHFDGTNTKQWNQAYYVNDTFWVPGSDAPVFVCVGGEGPALTGASVVASVHCSVASQWLQETKALMFGVEHRYYGCHNASACPVDSMRETSDLKYLSSRQALGDLAHFKTFATETYSLTDANKWVSFGGSYPGMLAGWFRLKFPHLVHASVASSAPVKAKVDMNEYNDVTAAAYSVSDNNVGGSPECTKAISVGHAKIGTMFGTVAGRTNLAAVFGRTAKFYESRQNQARFAGNGVAFFPAQGNDPTCTRKGCNINEICKIMAKDALGDEVHRLAALASGQAEWIAPKWSEQADAERAELAAAQQARGGLIANYWGYQTCAEFGFYQTCEIGSKCFFTQGYNTVNQSVSNCEAEFGVPAAQLYRNIEYTNSYYGADKPAGSCVLYPNGEVDPWHGLGVLTAPTPEIPVLMVGGASHHAWTHPFADDMQDSVKAAITTIRGQVTKFLAMPCEQGAAPDTDVQ